MSIADRQNELGKHLFQINANTLRGIGELQRDSVEKYFELNAAYWEKLADVTDLSGFVELQREFNEEMWNGVKESTQTQADLFKDALEDTGGAFRAAFSTEEEEAEAEDIVAAKSEQKRKVPKTAAKSKVDDSAEIDSLTH